MIVVNDATTITARGDFAALGLAGATYQVHNFRVLDSSPVIDAAETTAVPADACDLDDDGDTAEPIPLDLDGSPRFLNDLDTADTGVCEDGCPIVDMGAYG